MDLFDLSGQVAVITGGSRGIGLAIAEGLASAGAAVVIGNRTADQGNRAAEMLRRKKLKAHAIPVDRLQLRQSSTLAPRRACRVRRPGRIWFQQETLRSPP